MPAAASTSAIVAKIAMRPSANRCRPNASDHACSTTVSASLIVPELGHIARELRR